MTGVGWRYRGYGLVFLIGLVAVVLLSFAQFNRDFDASDPLHLESPRAGLLLTAGSPVKLRGVTIGHVDSLTATPDGADLALAIDPGALHLVPQDVSARIVPPTVFGGKYVEFTERDGDTAPAIASGATIGVSSVTVEINDTFAHLMTLLHAAPPGKVDAALTALAGTVEGRGEQTGRLLTNLDGYLGELDPQLDRLRQDLPLASSVLGTYADATPALLGTARNVTRTGDTVQANRPALQSFLTGITSLSNRTTAFVQQNTPVLTTALDALQPAARLFAEYSPEFPCFFQGLRTALPLAESAVGGKQPGLGVDTQFLPPQTPYRGAGDLPVIGADRGPRCYGLPDIPNGTQIPHQTFDTGPDPYTDAGTGGVTPANLLELFFGPILGATS